MSSQLPEVPRILYSALSLRGHESETQLLLSETVDAAVTRLITRSGTLLTVDFEERLKHGQVYVIQLDCKWPNDKAKAILDPKVGSVTLRNEGYDVIIKTKGTNGYFFIILNPFEVVYRIAHAPVSSPSAVVIAARSFEQTFQHRRGQTGDPRASQEIVDSAVLKLDPSRNPLDEFRLVKIAASHARDVNWAKKQVISILDRMWIDSRSRVSQCWQCILDKNESPRELRLRVLFFSFGRKVPNRDCGIKVVHDPVFGKGQIKGGGEGGLADKAGEDKTDKKGEEEEEEEERGKNVRYCFRPSHLTLRGSIDFNAVRKTADVLSSFLDKLGLGRA